MDQPCPTQQTKAAHLFDTSVGFGRRCSGSLVTGTICSSNELCHAALAAWQTILAWSLAPKHALLITNNKLGTLGQTLPETQPSRHIDAHYP